jgi:ATP/maltotriose-dependent transcriptional regulator MalT
VVGYRAKLGLAAQGRGDNERAVQLLEQARRGAADVSDLHLQTRIELWLAEVHQARGEHAQAAAALERASNALQDHEHEQA